MPKPRIGLARLRTTLGAAGCLGMVLAACGDVKGEAIVEGALAPKPSSGAPTNGSLSESVPPFQTSGSGGYGGRGGFGQDYPRASAAGNGLDPRVPEIQICKDCREHRDCPQNDSVCVREPLRSTGVCGFACRPGCPAGHTCVVLENVRTPQCVPVAGVCSMIFSPFEFASQMEMHAHSLMLLNQRRLERGLPPLILDLCLTREAETATSEWVRTRDQHGYFASSCEPVTPNCNCGWLEENQGFSGDLRQGWQQAVERVIDEELRTHPNDRFANNIFSETLTRVGLGIIVGDQKLWFTHAFGR